MHAHKASRWLQRAKVIPPLFFRSHIKSDRPAPLLARYEVCSQLVAMSQIDTPIFLVDAQWCAKCLTRPGADDHRTEALPSVPIERALDVTVLREVGQVREAISTAIDSRNASVVLVGGEGPKRRLVSIRPAREDRFAVARASCLDGGASSLEGTLLENVFSITPAGADIALSLLRGESLDEISERRNSQLETVRGQVKDLLRRMGVQSQKQLTAVLSQVAFQR